MKKKVLIIVSIFVILIGYISYIYFNSKKDNLNSLSSGISMYVYNRTTNSFVANASIPVGNIYILNTTLSHCVSGSNISGYNTSAGTINYALNGADWCYIYFEYEKQVPVISNLTASGSAVTATLTDNAALGSYIVSTSATAPSGGYTSISGTSYNLSYSTEIYGTNTYYIYVKDRAGNITKSSSFSLTFTPQITAEYFNDYCENNNLENIYYDDNYDFRYVGANPDNYACFDDGSGGCINYYKSSEYQSCDTGLFRIIGVFDQDSHGNVGYLYKLTTVRGPYISWDETGENDWENSTLNYYLNNNELSYFTSTQLAMIETTSWYTGNNITQEDNVYEIYDSERGIVYGQRIENSSSISKIGLIYLSDYMLATSASSCLSISEWDQDCYENDWLSYLNNRTDGSSITSFLWDMWTMTSITEDEAYFPFLVGQVDGINPNYSDMENYALPTFYLKSSAYISGGSGTSTDPYRFAMD